MNEAYDPDKPSTFGEARKCGCCGWYFDLTREGVDYTEEASHWRVTLCGDCRA